MAAPWMRRVRQYFLADRPAQVAASGLLAPLISLVTAPVIARLLGPEGRGETVAAIVLTSLVSILLAFGVPLELRRLAAMNEVSASLRTARRMIAIAVIPSSALGAFFGFTVFASLDAGSKVLAVVAVASSPLSISWMIDASVLIGLGRYRGVFVLRVAQPLTFLVVVVIGLTAGIASVSFVIFASIVGNLVTAIIGLSLLPIGFRGEVEPVGALVRRSARFAGSSIAEAATNRVDQVAVLPLIGSAEAGLYSVAAVIASLPLTIGHALGSTYFRELAKASALDRRQIKLEAARASSSMTLAVCALIAFAVPFGVPLVFGEQFVPAIMPTLLALIGAYAMTVGFVVSLMLAAESRGSWMTISQVASLIVGIVLLLWLGPLLLANGAAAASTLAYIFLLILLAVGAKIPPRCFLPSFSGFIQAIQRLGKS